MNIRATSIDHHRADISQRELFACNEEQVKRIYEIAENDPQISGAVLINTCNRTELYISMAQDPEDQTGSFQTAPQNPEAPDPFRILCDVMDVDEEAMRHLQVTLKNEDAFRHLCLLTAGARSQLWGDSQIITQVGEAVDFARDLDATDSVLNTVFRLGITAGKEIRSHVDLHIHDASTAGMAAGRILEDQRIRSVLVIGNGAIGRMVASRLADSGIDTSMTLRRYANGQAEIPEGVRAVPFTERYEAMEDADAVVSATASPHLVVTRKELETVKAIPRVMIDMAVPRDIEESVGEIDGVQCYNIDEISRGHHIHLKEEQLSRLNEYIEEQVEEFYRWERSKDKVENKIERLTDDDRDPSDRSHFPLFIDSLHVPVLVVGGGNIAERRVMTMAEFGFDIRIVSEDLTDTLRRMVDGGAAEWIRGRYEEDLIEEAWMILACTNDRDTNRKVGRDCRRRNKLVNVCDARNESTFWFPAVALNDELTVGLVGRGTDHMNVKKAASALRRVVESKRYK